MRGRRRTAVPESDCAQALDRVPCYGWIDG